MKGCLFRVLKILEHTNIMETPYSAQSDTHASQMHHCKIVSLKEKKDNYINKELSKKDN